MQYGPKNRVLMLLENNPYPQDDRVSREARSLSTAGYRVTVICPRDPGQPWSDTLDGVRVYRYPAPVPADGVLGYVWEYGYSLVAMFVISLWVFLQHGFDVLHVHNPPDLVCVIGAFYKLFGVRFVFDHHDLAPEMYYARFSGKGNRLLYTALLGFERLSMRLADLVIATNQSYRAIALQRGGVPAARIAVVRNGPDPRQFKPTAPDPELRARAPIIIAYAGIMGVQDGIDYLLRALYYLAYDLGRHDFHCVLMGKGDDWDYLQDLAVDLGIDCALSFTGWVPRSELMRYLSSADICVTPDPSNPYNDRSTMIKMMEYMAVGKPIVAFDLPEHRVSAQDAALYAQPNDERDFARQIEALMDDPARRERMGRYGRERLVSTLAWSIQEQQLLAAYATLVAPQPQPAASQSA